MRSSGRGQPRVDPVACGHRRLAAWRLDGQRRRRHPEQQRSLDRHPFGQTRRQGADQRVTGSGRIHRLRRRRGQHRAVGQQPRAGRAEGEHRDRGALSAQRLQLRLVDTGGTVGYGATFRTSRPSILATIGLGYADGLMRAIGNKGSGAIAGMRAPVVGRVSMDLATLDVTDVPPDTLKTGGDVEFIGDTISLEEFAALAGTASYEVLTSLGSRMARHYEPAA